MAVAAAADVINFSKARRPYELGEGFHEIEAMDIVAHLFAFISKNAVGPAAHCADHEIREKTVQLSAGVRRSSQATAAKTNGRHPEITSVFLHEKIGRSFGSAEEGMLRGIDTHRFGNSRLVFMAGFDFPALFELVQRQPIWRVAINFVRRCKNERRLWTKTPRRFQQIQCAVGVNGEIGLRIARRPIVRWLRSRMHDRVDLSAVLLE